MTRKKNRTAIFKRLWQRRDFVLQNNGRSSHGEISFIVFRDIWTLTIFEKKYLSFITWYKIIIEKKNELGIVQVEGTEFIYDEPTNFSFHPAHLKCIKCPRIRTRIWRWNCIFLYTQKTLTHRNLLINNSNSSLLNFLLFGNTFARPWKPDK